MTARHVGGGDGPIPGAEPTPQSLSLAAAHNDPTAGVKLYLPSAVRGKVRVPIAEGKKAPTIAKECGVSPMIGYREMKRFD